jgi:purine-nucleoside phosphorylase
MVDAYDPDMIKLCHDIASSLGIKLFDSVYAGLPGPNIETKAEYKYLHIIGATVVGMSTVPEVIVAKHMDMKTLVLTAVTNKCYPISAIKKVTHEEVIEVAQKVEQKITSLVTELIKQL